MNFKRRSCKRRVRCTICTANRWKGNKGGTFDGRWDAKTERLNESARIDIELDGGIK